MDAEATRRVLVTRPEEQAVAWVERLGRHGVPAEALPLLSIEAVEDGSGLAAAWAGLPAYRLVMFVSPNAARCFFAARPNGLRDWPSSVQAASPGPGTSADLAAFGVPIANIVEPAEDSPQFDSEALWARLSGQDWQGIDVLVVAGEGGRDWLARQLQEHGARVRRLVAYRRAAPDWTPARSALAEAALAQPQGYLWFFSSSQAVDHLLARYPAPAWARSLALATHPRIVQTARRAGFGEVLLSRPTLQSVAEACIQSSANAASP